MERLQIENQGRPGRMNLTPTQKKFREAQENIRREKQADCIGLIAPTDHSQIFFRHSSPDPWQPTTRPKSKRASLFAANVKVTIFPLLMASMATTSSVLHATEIPLSTFSVKSLGTRNVYAKTVRSFSGSVRNATPQDSISRTVNDNRWLGNFTCTLHPY